MSECFMPVRFMGHLLPSAGRTPVGPRARRRPPVRNGVVLSPVIWYVLSTGVRWHDRASCHGVQQDELHPGGYNSGRKTAFKEALHMKLLALLNVTASWTWMSSSLTARWCPPPAAAAYGPQPDGPCQIRLWLTRCWWTATAFGMTCAAISGIDDNEVKVTGDLSCRNASDKPRRIHGHFTALASAGHAGWAEGRTADGTQWRRAAGDLVCFVDRRSLARYSSRHGVLGTNYAPEVATVAGKRRLGSVIHETAGPSQP